MHCYHKVHANVAPGFNLELKRKGNCIGFPFSFSHSDSCAHMGLESRANHVKEFSKFRKKKKQYKR